eukprot:m.127737 g.127737  ORF g.127737 m.127737 type:complete len:339 (+) comp22252_c1_seq2:71-1087(+)
MWLADGSKEDAQNQEMMQRSHTDGLVNGLTRQHQERRVGFGGGDGHAVPTIVQQRHTLGLNDVSIIVANLHATLPNEDDDAVAVDKWQRVGGSRGWDHHIPKIDWGECFRRTFDAIELSSKHSSISIYESVIACDQRNVWNILCEDRLIAWLCHLVLLRKIEPDLAHLKLPSFLSKFSRVELFVHNPTAGGHPLYITRPDGPAVTETVLVINLSCECNCNCLKPPVRVHANPKLLGRGRKLLRWSVIEHQKRRDSLGKRQVGKYGVHVEPIADPMSTCCREDLLDGTERHLWCVRTLGQFKLFAVDSQERESDEESEPAQHKVRGERDGVACVYGCTV